jgi:hypothetical protein
LRVLIAVPMNRCSGRVRKGTDPFDLQAIDDAARAREHLLDDALVVFHRRALRDGQRDDGWRDRRSACRWSARPPRPVALLPGILADREVLDDGGAGQAGARPPEARPARVAFGGRASRNTIAPNG